MNIFSFIKSSVPILEIVQQYTNLKQIGTYWKGICPFHSERTPSFTVSPNKDIFYCFGCQLGGDVISFIAKAENCSQFEAAQMLAEKRNIKIPENILNELKIKEINLDEKSRYFKLCEIIANWCNRNLSKSKTALNYLKSRNIIDETIEKFSIGYFEPGQNGLKFLNEELKKSNLLFQDLAEFHIITEGHSGFYSPFEDRIIFPIKNLQGEFCGFGGRIFKENDERAKYYNSKENPFFNKGSILFGFDLAKRTIQNEKYAFLVEGYIDQIAMYQNGYKNSVATLGTACTSEHIKLLSRFVDKLYIVYDSDEAGYKAILRLTELAWNANMEVCVIRLPDKEDPASFFDKNLNFKNLIKNSESIYQFFIDSAKKEFINSSLSEKLSGVQKITKVIYQLEDPIKKSLLLQEVSQQFAIPLELISAKNIQHIEIEENKKEQSLEDILLGAILHDIKRLSYIKDEIDFFSNDIKEILKLIDETNFDLKEFVSELTENTQKLVLETYMKYDKNLDFSAILKQFQRKNWKKIVLKLKQDLVNEDDINKKYAKLEKLKTLQKKYLSGSYE